MITNVAKTAFASSLFVDKIIGTYTGSFTLNAPGGAGLTNTVTVPLPTNINGTTFFEGIYSINGGSSWNGFQTHINHVQSVDPTINPQGEYYVIGASTAGTFNVIGKNVANASATLLFNYTVLYKLALIAKPSQGIITPQPIGSHEFFNSSRNYQKIAFDTITPTSGTNKTTTVTHNLGYAPRVRAFVEVAGTLHGKGFYLGSVVSITTTTASILVPGTVTGTVYIRVYYDQ